MSCSQEVSNHFNDDFRFTYFDHVLRLQVQGASVKSQTNAKEQSVAHLKLFEREVKDPVSEDANREKFVRRTLCVSSTSNFISEIPYKDTPAENTLLSVRHARVV